MTSTSYDNLAVISLEFEWEVNLDEASNDVRDAVDKAMQTCRTILTVRPSCVSIRL